MTAVNKKPIGILGGTFDPIHFGHLRAAYEILQQLQLQQIRFIPCQIPVHKPEASATIEQRLTMLKLAIANQPNFSIDEKELQRTTPSFMVETLTSLRQELPQISLCLLLGQDAFASFTSWHRWQDILQLAHLIIMNRPSYTAPTTGAEKNLLGQCLTTNFAELSNNLNGKIFCHEITALEISSTKIRQEVKQGLIPQYLLPQAVLDFIVKNKVYS